MKTLTLITLILPYQRAHCWQSDFQSLIIDRPTPFVDPIAEDRRTVVCPFIDVLDFETFQYRAQDEGARGAFDWEFFYKRLPITDDDKKHPARPFE